MKQQKFDLSEKIATPVSEDEYLKQTMQFDDDLEWEQWGQWVNELNQLSKKQLIDLLIEARFKEDRLWSVLLGRNGHLGSIEKKIAKLQSERELRIKNLTKGRQTQALKKVAEGEVAKALGVDDYYGLLCEAVMLVEKNPNIRSQHPTKAKAIREIVVNLLCEANRSRHTYDRSTWVNIVRKNVDTRHIDTAKRKFENNYQTEAD